MTTVTVPFEEPAKPVGHPLVRTLRAILVERRLPTALAQGLDRLLVRVGWPTRVRRVGAYRFHTRRLTADEFYLRDVVERGEYRRSGYEVRPGDTVVDVGANIGSFAIPAALASGTGRVIAVEPARDNLAMLLRNLAANGADRVTVEPVAIAATSGSMTLRHDPGNTGGHRLVGDFFSTTSGSEDAPAADASVETVTVVTLAELFRRHAVDRCDLLKLDCEGAEFAILAGLSPSLAARIARIVLEYHADDPASKSAAWATLAERLATLGFVIDWHVDFDRTRLGLLFARRVEDSPPPSGFGE
jgi:FkbM family methyltransferase